MTPRPLVDRAYKINARYTLTECVNPDGTEAYWILDRDNPEGRTIDIPEHERLGPLPRDVADRLALTCGAPCRTRHGRPCRAPVHTPGERCHRHATAQDALPGLGLLGACAE